jgi:hypothetical protein
MSFPWVMTWFTVPLTTIALGAAGFSVACRGWLKELKLLLRDSNLAKQETDPRQSFVLFIGCMLAPLVVISLPSTPIFGGTKHWLPAYPFVALFAGLAATRVVQACRTLMPQAIANSAAAVCIAVLLVPSAIESAHSQSYGLSHYSVTAGGVPGSADLGMNRQFWGFTTRQLTDYFNRNLARGGRVWICDTTSKAWEMLWRDGHLRRDIRITGDIARADFAIVHHEHHFAEVDFQIWSLYNSVQPAYVLHYDGVPIVSVYKNPKRKKR